MKRINRWQIVHWAAIVLLCGIAGYNVWRWVECDGAFVRGMVGYTCLENHQ